MEGSVDETLDERGVARGRGNMELADSWRRDADRFFVLLQTICDNDDDSLGGIIRHHFLFLWADINGSSIRGGVMGGLSSVSASFRHGGRYAGSHT